MTAIDVERSAPTTTAGRRTVHPSQRATRIVEPATQLLLVVVAALTYFAVRGLTEAGHDTAVAHAHHLLTFERHLGLDGEAWLQRWTVGHDGIVTAMNWIYIWGHWPVIVTSLVWLHRSRRDAYRLMRNAMFVSGAIGLIVFATFPVAPPRLTGFGFVDTVTEHSNSYRVLQPPALVNKYAAVPSLHVGWNFLVDVFVWRHARRHWLRVVAVASPALMFTAVVLTANHFIVDGIAGIAIATIGLVVTTRLDPRVARARTGDIRSLDSAPTTRAADHADHDGTDHGPVLAEIIAAQEQVRVLHAGGAAASTAPASGDPSESVTPAVIGQTIAVAEPAVHTAREEPDHATS